MLYTPFILLTLLALYVQRSYYRSALVDAEARRQHTLKAWRDEVAYILTQRKTHRRKPTLKH